MLAIGSQLNLNAQDRRNALIAVMADESRKPQATALATELYWWMKNHDASGALDRMLGGLMHILLSHTVDQNLVDSAPDTLLRRDVLQASSNDGDGLYWLIHSNRYKRDAWLSACPVVTVRADGQIIPGHNMPGHASPTSNKTELVSFSPPDHASLPGSLRYSSRGISGAPDDKLAAAHQAALRYALKAGWVVPYISPSREQYCRRYRPRRGAIAAAELMLTMAPERRG